MDVHLRDLRYFLVVAEELHFTRASERLFVSQPALSRQIAKLERDLRVRLLERDPRSVRLTPAGEALLAGVRPVLAVWDETSRAVADTAANADAVLRIGIQTSIGRGILARLTDAVRITYPPWTVRVTQVPWDDPTAGLADHSTDLAVLWLPLVDRDRYRSVTVATEPRRIALAAGHRLAGASEVALTDLAGEPFIALPESAGAQRSFWIAEDERDDDPVIGGVAHTAEEAIEAVTAGLGVAIIAEGNAQLYERDDLITRPVRGLSPASLAFAWRRDDHREIVRAAIEAGAA